MGHSARLRAQQLRRNDADSRAQIRADTARSWARKHRSASTLLKNGTRNLSEGWLQEGGILEKLHGLQRRASNRIALPFQAGFHLAR